MHAHTVGPGQSEDLNGNKIVDNVIGQNNLAGHSEPADLHPTRLDRHAGQARRAARSARTGLVAVAVRGRRSLGGGVDAAQRQRRGDDHVLGVGAGQTVTVAPGLAASTAD